MLLFVFPLFYRIKMASNNNTQREKMITTQSPNKLLNTMPLFFGRFIQKILCCALNSSEKFTMNKLHINRQCISSDLFFPLQNGFTFVYLANVYTPNIQKRVSFVCFVVCAHLIFSSLDMWNSQQDERASICKCNANKMKN